MLPNQVLNAIPERDEELEKFIEECHRSHADVAGDVYVEEFYKACALVAAFSASSAREKAIEECLAEVPEQKDKGDDEFATGYYKAFNDIHAYIARLKTK